MKKLFILCVSLFITGLTYSQTVFMENESWDAVKSKAVKENRMIFMDCYTSWCGPCKMLERNIFPQKEVGDFYNTNFINAHFDMEKGEGISIARKYGINSYPTLLFIDGDGVIIYKTSGYMSAPEFINIGKSAINPENKIWEKLAQ